MVAYSLARAACLYRLGTSSSLEIPVFNRSYLSDPWGGSSHCIDLSQYRPCRLFVCMSLVQRPVFYCISWVDGLVAKHRELSMLEIQFFNSYPMSDSGSACHIDRLTCRLLDLSIA